MINIIIFLLIILIGSCLFSTKQHIEYFQNPRRYRQRYRKRNRHFNRLRRRRWWVDNSPFYQNDNGVLVDSAPGYATTNRTLQNLVSFDWLTRFAGVCKDGCTKIGNGGWGCQFPGSRNSDCLFASDCYGC
jgi:hypothetical protein